MFHKFGWIILFSLLALANSTGSNGISERIVGGYRADIIDVPWQVVIHQSMPDRSMSQCGAVLISTKWILTASHCVINSLNNYPIEAYFGVTELSQLNSNLANSGRQWKFSNRRNVLYHYIYSLKNQPSYNYHHHHHHYYNKFRLQNLNPIVRVSSVISRRVVQIINNFSGADLVALKLNESLVLTEQIKPISLPEQGENFDYKIAMASGFGATSYNEQGDSKPANHLHAVHVPILSKSACVHLYAKAFVDGNKASTYVNNPNILCAGLQEGGRDACIGDSGGPLAVCVDNFDYRHHTTIPVEKKQCNGHWKLAGIISNGYRCAEPGIPGLYTNVSEFANWIQSIINS